MIISKARLVNVGSSKVATLKVRRGGELKLITIDNEVVVGGSKDKMLWFATSWRDLVKHIGAANAVNVYKKYKAAWKWSTSIEDESDIQALAALMDFVASARKLNDSWRDFLINNYPFIEDFELVLLDVIDWQRAVVAIAEDGDWEI